MNVLVKFVGGPVAVYPMKKVRVSSSSNSKSVCVRDGGSYMGELLCISDDTGALHKIAENMNSGRPRVHIIRCIPEEILERSSPGKSVCGDDTGALNIIPGGTRALNIISSPMQKSFIEGDNDEQDVNMQFSCENYLVCSICGCLVLDLTGHMRLYHNDENFILDDNNEEPVEVLRKKRSPIKHYCRYCKTMQIRLARHLERKHPEKEEVRQVLKFPKGSKARRIQFAELQKENDFIYNSQRTSTEKPITMRKTASGHSVPCPHCKGFYSQKNIRNHVRLNCQPKQKGECTEKKRSLLVQSKSLLCNIHEKASKDLREKIFPKLQNDQVTKAIAHDELVIVYANLLVLKYSTSEHHHPMIRNRMRHISRILLEMQTINSNITDVESIYDPSNYDTFVKAVHNIGGFKEGRFNAPSFGTSSVTLIGQIGKVLISECIKRHDENTEKNATRFLQLLETSANATINKIAISNRTQRQRSNVVTLPKTEDVKRLIDQLNLKIKGCIQDIKINFDVTLYTTMTKLTLVKIMIINRKRPGDVEKTQIVEYRNLQMVDADTLKTLNSSEMQFASLFGRYITRGKLDSSAPVLVSKHDIFCIDTILSYRDQANVNKQNQYVFATPSGCQCPYFKAGISLKEFCESVGLQNKNLSATKLRKHFATNTSNLKDADQNIVSEFMGHARAIHDKIYKQRLIVKDITTIAPVLLSTGGLHINDVHEECQIIPREMEELEPSTSTQNFYQPEKHSQDESQYVTPENSHTGSESDEDYVPDLSVILEGDEDDSDHVVKTSVIKRRNRLFSKPLKRKRSAWTTPEKTKVRSIFKHYFSQDDSLPSLETCQEFIHGVTELESRTPLVVRSWIAFEKKRILRKSQETVQGWSTPSRKACRKYFQKYYETETYPSTDELQNAINKIPELSATTVSKLRSHLQHDFKYMRKRNSTPDN